MTPCQYKSQLKVYMELHKARGSAKQRTPFPTKQTDPVDAGFIDQLPGW